MILQDVYVEIIFVTCLRGIWYYLQVPQLEPHYTTSTRAFPLNVRRHLVLSEGRR